MPVVNGNPVLLVIDIQEDGYLPGDGSGIPRMPGFVALVEKAVEIVGTARRAGVPIIFTQEVHRASGVDIGRELDGSETMHCVEDDPSTALVERLQPRGDREFLVKKRRYSAFFATELEILLRALHAGTLFIIGGLTNVCVHYTSVDAHQRDYYIRVVTDCVIGSSPAAHEATIAAITYLQREAPINSMQLQEAFLQLAAVAG